MMNRRKMASSSFSSVPEAVHLPLEVTQQCLQQLPYIKEEKEDLYEDDDLSYEDVEFRYFNMNAGSKPGVPDKRKPAVKNGNGNNANNGNKITMSPVSARAPPKITMSPVTARAPPTISKISTSSPSTSTSTASTPAGLPPQKKMRKQELKPLNDEDIQLEILCKDEFNKKRKLELEKEKEAEQEKETEGQPPKHRYQSQPPPLYTLNPDDFAGNPTKQQQIRKAKQIHGYHMKQKVIVQVLAEDNARLRKLINFFQKREQLISSFCSCSEVKRVLKRRGPPCEVPPEIEIPQAYRNCNTGYGFSKSTRNRMSHCNYSESATATSQLEKQNEDIKTETNGSQDNNKNNANIKNDDLAPSSSFRSESESSSTTDEKRQQLPMKILIARKGADQLVELPKDATDKVAAKLGFSPKQSDQNLTDKNPQNQIKENGSSKGGSSSAGSSTMSYVKNGNGKETLDFMHKPKERPRTSLSRFLNHKKSDEIKKNWTEGLVEKSTTDSEDIKPEIPIPNTGTLKRSSVNNNEKSKTKGASTTSRPLRSAAKTMSTKEMFSHGRKGKAEGPQKSNQYEDDMDMDDMDVEDMDLDDIDWDNIELEYARVQDYAKRY